MFLYISIKTNAQSVSTPRQLVNNFGSIEIGAKNFKTIYTVPVDSILIITDFLINGFYSTSSLFINKKLVISLDKNSWFHTCTGIQFESESLIMLYNEANFSNGAKWHLIGYLQKREEK